ncbi:site-specific integrase [Nocardia vinacea]|uniref:tyrosine-type recombinase/integrase n=1 Tax=Nocardia vinacea TaxID=96468 RepID=UPI002E121DCA|nr:site-specific integrase [Nocardia vinacea]WSF98916.1 site-specific integrase [Nocardia vinacea]
MAAVRPEFRSTTLRFAAEDPVFGGGRCRVEQCERTARSRGMCPGHHQRWADAGRPDIEDFAASTDHRWARQRPNMRCRVTDCGYGCARGGMCQLHAQRWTRAGRPNLQQWLAEPLPFKRPAPGVTCAITCCDLWPKAQGPFCHPHAATWKVNGRPDIGEFVRRFDDIQIPSGETIRLDELEVGMRLEMQYVLQHRHDQREGTITPDTVMRVVRLLANATASSLLDLDESAWRALAGEYWPRDTRSIGFLNYARRVVEDLAEPTGWETEYPRDAWRMHRLGFDGRRVLRFNGIAQPWLKALAKRWVRWRLSTGLGLEAGGGRPVLAITRFSRFLDRVGVTEITEVTRPVLERYLADLRSEPGGPHRQGTNIGLLNGFFAAIRQHRWDARLPAEASFFTQDYPKRDERAPRALPDNVMAQLEQPINLDRWDNPTYRLITLILMRCGLRITDTTRLRGDCVVTDADGAPYLRYFNHKMKRDALVPIDEELRELINGQRQRVLQRWQASIPWLFPRPTKNITGEHPVGSSTYRLALYRWLEYCDIRDEHRAQVRLTPHQWRHTLGTRLINRDVPQEVVRKILDHDSPQMTAHYARLHDTTVRRHWEAARKVDINGDTVRLDPDGPLAEAAWAKQRISRVTQALPNGFCGLPVQKSCPHANACLTCPMFITTPEFLPQHRNQRQQVLQIIDAAEARGQQRLAEMNKGVLTNLNQIIDALDDETRSNQKAVPDAS